MLPNNNTEDNIQQPNKGSNDDNWTTGGQDIHQIQEICEKVLIFSFQSRSTEK